MKKNLPYVYYVKNKTTNLKYIVVRFSKTCHPNDFWVTYFTSSKLIKKLIELYGVDDFEYRIVKKFECEFEAQKYENELLNIAVKRNDYLNLKKDFLIDDKEGYFLHKEKMFKVRSFYAKLQATLKQGFHGVSEEKRLEICSKGGTAAAIVNKKNNTGIFNEDVRRRQHETLKEKQISAFYDPILKKDISSKGGKVGYFSKNYYEKNGLTEEDRIKAQSDRGKIGGVKNKGFIWYNDGFKSFKYTKTNQDELSFGEFLIKNPKFKKGRIINKNKKYEN